MGELSGVPASAPQQIPRRMHKVESGRGIGPRVSVLLIDAMRLTRDCVAQALATAARDLDIVELLSVDHIVPEHRAGVVLFNLHSTAIGDSWTTERIAEIHRRTEAPIIVISSGDDETSALRAVSDGLRGVVPASVDIGMLVAAIRLVLAGGTFIPPEILTRYAQKAAEPANAGEDDVTFLGFTPREAEVLGKIREGKINKVIAYELNISESTVKIHVRHIMRKLNATTRTEVAYLVQNKMPTR